jgi:hypothetical protein
MLCPCHFRISEGFTDNADPWECLKRQRNAWSDRPHYTPAAKGGDNYFLMGMEF